MKFSTMSLLVAAFVMANWSVMIKAEGNWSQEPEKTQDNEIAAMEEAQTKSEDGEVYVKRSTTTDDDDNDDFIVCKATSKLKKLLNDTKKDLNDEVQKLREKINSLEQNNAKGLPSCSAIKKHHPNSKSGQYEINPKCCGSSIKVHCDMEAENGVGVTVIGHNSEKRTVVNGHEGAGSYVRKIVYEADADSLAALTKSSQHCKQFIRYECHRALLFRDNECWWVSRDGHRMNYWGGAKGQNKKCACALTKSCAGGNNCNCDANDAKWRKDEGFFTDKSKLPVSSLHFGDTGGTAEKGFHTLGKLLCWG